MEFSIQQRSPGRYCMVSMVAAVVALVSGAAQPALSTKLSGPDWYAKANKDLAKDTILTTANVTVVTVHDSDEIPRNAMWLASPDTAYGFALHNAVLKGSPISGRDLIQADFRDLVSHPGDPLWLQYAKYAIDTDKKHDFVTSQRYDAQMLAELNKIGDKHQQLVYQEQSDWVMEALRHSEGMKEYYKQSDEARKKDMNSRPSSIFDAFKPDAMPRLNALQKKLVDDQI